MESLFIDTNIQYDLDLSLFPGISDPRLCSQPALLIATSPKAAWIASAFNFNNDDIDICQKDNVVESLDPDDLYNFIDSFDLINSDVNSNLAGTGDLETLVNDILESASIDTNGGNIMQATCKQDSYISDYQCMFPELTSNTSKNKTCVSSSSCEILQSGLANAHIDGHGGRGGVGGGSSCQSPASDCLCIEHFLDSSFITDLIKMNDSRKRKRTEYCFNEKINKRGCLERDYFDQRDLSALTWATDNTSTSLYPGCTVSETEALFPRDS